MHFFDSKNDTKLKCAELYSRYSKSMYTTAYGILNDKYLSEDAVSESFIRIMKNLHKIKDIDSKGTKNFLNIICRNVAIDILNKRKNINYYDDMTQYDDVGSNERISAEDIVINKETEERIREMIKALKPIYSDIIILKTVYGYKNAEISKMFGIGESAVKKRYERAKAILKKELGKEDILL